MTFGQGLQGLAHEWGLNNYYHAKVEGQYGVGNARLLGALQTIVDATTPESGYIIGFVGDGTAGTSFESKHIIITSKPLMNIQGPQVVDRFVVAAGLVCHEVSHIRYGQHTANAVHEHYHGHKVADAISNILDDTRIELRFSADFPGVDRTVFRTAAKWIVENEGMNGSLVHYPTDVPSAFQLLIAATRYDEFMRWPYQDAKLQTAREFCKRWADKYSADDTVETHMAGVEAMLTWLRTFLPDVDTSDPGTDDDDEYDDSGEDEAPEDGPTQPGPSKSGKGKNKGEPKPGTANLGDGSLPGDEPKDEPESGEGEGDDEGDESESESKAGEGEGKGKGESNGQPTDGEGDGEGDFDSSEEPDETVSRDERAGGAHTASDKGKGGGGHRGGAVKDGLRDVTPPPSYDEQIASKNTAQDQTAQRIANKVLQTIIAKGEALDHNSLLLHRDGYGYGYGSEVRTPGTAEVGDAEALGNAFNSTKYTPSEYEPGHAYGRLRSRDAWKASRGQQDVFSRRLAHGDTSVHLVLVLDWSGSMSYNSRESAVDRLVVAIAEGLAPVKSFRMTAYQYNANVWRVWGSDDGIPAEEGLKNTAHPAGGTPTGDALDLVITDEFTNLRPEERMLVCSITDGSPDDDTRVARTVAHWRERGVGILGVNVAATGQQDIDNIIDQYGEEGGIVFDGNVLDLADELTERVGRLLQGAMVGR